METSKLIADEAAALFMQNGISSTCMDTIATNLGMSKKTIYRYYRNKEQLVTLFVTQEIYANANKCRQLIQNADNAIAELFMLVNAIRDLFTRVNTGIVNELKKNHTDAGLLLKNYRSVLLYDMIERNLARGLDEQVYRQDINRRLLSKLMLENFMLTLNGDFLNGGTIEQWFGYLIGGIVSAKGFATMEIYKNEYGISVLTGSGEQPLWDH